MTSFVARTSIDCHNAYELSEWWKQVLGYVDDADPNLRATRSAWSWTRAPGAGWVVLADPEANEFCILRSDDEKTATPASAGG